MCGRFRGVHKLIARHEAFEAWLEAAAAVESTAAATSDATDVIHFIKKHQIDIGVNKPHVRHHKRQAHFRQFAAQLIKLRRLGVVHGETRDNRGMGLFLLKSHAHLWHGRTALRELLNELCEIAGGADSTWTTKYPPVVAAIQQLDLRSAVAFDGGKLMALVAGPLSWLNHSLRSGVTFNDTRVPLLKERFEECGMLFDAEGFNDRREILMRYDFPGTETWEASVAKHAWYDDRKCNKRKR